MSSYIIPTFRANDRVVCIDHRPDDFEWTVDLTYGKTYDVFEDSVMDHKIGFEIVWVRDDTGDLYDYSVSRFITLSEYRASMVNNILDL